MIMTGSSLAPPRATVFAPLQILLVHDIARALGHLVVEPLSRLVGLVGYPIDAAQPRRPRLGADRLDQRAPHALAARRPRGEEVLQVAHRHEPVGVAVEVIMGEANQPAVPFRTRPPTATPS